MSHKSAKSRAKACGDVNGAESSVENAGGNGAATMTHFDDKGEPRMVDIGGKAKTRRTATVRATVWAHPRVFRMLALQHGQERSGLRKGDALLVAKLAGVQGAKRTADLIPLCHNAVPLDSVRCDLRLESGRSADGSGRVLVESTVSTVWHTGVEMEAYVCTLVACATLYDMCKSVHKGGLVISDVRLLFKEGGKSGVYRDGD